MDEGTVESAVLSAGWAVQGAGVDGEWSEQSRVGQCTVDTRKPTLRPLLRAKRHRSSHLSPLSSATPTPSAPFCT